MRKNVYKNNDDIFKAATQSVTGEFDLTELEPSVETIERKYLQPIVSADQYSATLAALYDGQPTAQEKIMLRHARTAVGYLALLDQLPVLNTKIGNSGLFVVTGNDRVAASEYRTEDLKKTLRAKGYAAFDDLAQYIEGNTAYFPEYLASPERADRLNSICISAPQFQRIYGQWCPHFLFLAVRKHIRDAELDYLSKHIGVDMYESLIEHAQNEDMRIEVAATYKNVLRHAQYAAVHRGMAEAIPQLNINITADGLVVLDNSRNKNASPAKIAAGDRWPFILVNQAQKVAEAHLASLLKLLNKTASATIFSEYFNSEHYKDPTKTTQNLSRRINKGGYFGL